MSVDPQLHASSDVAALPFVTLQVGGAAHSPRLHTSPGSQTADRHVTIAAPLHLLPEASQNLLGPHTASPHAQGESPAATAELPSVTAHSDVALLLQELIDPRQYCPLEHVVVPH